MAFTIIPQLRKQNGKLDLTKYAVIRWIRFTPSLIFAILLIFLMPVLPNGGPIYKSSTSHLFEVCEKNWWKDLLYVTNWFESNDIVSNLVFRRSDILKDSDFAYNLIKI
jgi:hypothetical protein